MQVVLHRHLLDRASAVQGFLNMIILAIGLQTRPRCGTVSSSLVSSVKALASSMVGKLPVIMEATAQMVSVDGP